MDNHLSEAVANTMKRVASSRARAKDHLRSAIEIEKRVIAQNEMLAEAVPAKREIHESMVQEGKDFLREANDELRVLEEADAEPDLTISDKSR